MLQHSLVRVATGTQMGDGNTCLVVFALLSRLLSLCGAEASGSLAVGPLVLVSERSGREGSRKNTALLAVAGVLAVAVSWLVVLWLLLPKRDGRLCHEGTIDIGDAVCGRGQGRRLILDRNKGRVERVAVLVVQILRMV